MPSVSDLWGNALEITPSYVAHRSRLIDVHLIHTFQTKGKRLLINTFKQNEHVPTMCVFFANKEMAQEAYQMMKQVYYGDKQLVVSKAEDMPYSCDLILAILPLFMILYSLFSNYFLLKK